MSKQSMTRVLRPEFKSVVNGKKNIPALRDYIEVPRLSTHGSWKVVETLPFETLARLHIFRNHLTGVVTHS